MTDIVKDGGFVSLDRSEPAGVVRSSNLDIRVADFCTVAWMGRDFDMSLFAISPQVKSFSGFTDNAIGPAHIDIQQAYTETVRVRLSPPAAVHIVGNLLFNLRHSDASAFQQAIANIRSMIDELDAEASTQ